MYMYMCVHVCVCMYIYIYRYNFRKIKIKRTITQALLFIAWCQVLFSTLCSQRFILLTSLTTLSQVYGLEVWLNFYELLYCVFIFVYSWFISFAIRAEIM
jgi:hypothetical protein